MNDQPEPLAKPLCEQADPKREEFDKLIATLRKECPQRTLTGYTDTEGTPIRAGSIIEFWFSETRGYADEEVPGATRMVDLVIVDRGEFYAHDLDIMRGCFLWKAAVVCKVVGDLFDNPEPLFTGLMRFQETTEGKP